LNSYVRLSAITVKKFTPFPSEWETSIVIRRVTVCLSVCGVRTHISKTTCANITKFYMLVFLRPLLGHSLAALRYVLYFRFCEWRHILNLTARI